MYELLDYVPTQWLPRREQRWDQLIACLIFGVVMFGLYKWVNRERKRRTPNSASAGLSRAERR